MAEVISQSILQAATQKPVNWAYEEIMTWLEFKSNVDSLQITRTTIEAALLDADSIVVHRHTQQDTLKKLLRELQKVVDLLDAKETRALRRLVMGGSWFKKEARLFFSPSNQLVARLKDAQKVKAIRENLDSIARDYAQFGSIVSLQSARQPQTWRVQTNAPHIITDLVIGREEDRKNIIRMIVSDNCVAAEIPSVASIVGIGGVGKTTLARYGYNDERVKNSFDVRFWVDNYGDFNVKEVLEKILASTSCGVALNWEMDEPDHHIFRAIGAKKFLFVLDNIWYQDSLRVKWLELKKLLAMGANGSKVLITTRNQIVAGVMDSTDPYMLGDLSDHDSWLLFQQVAFTTGQPAGVETIGKEIAQMCPNVPLVIRSIGGFLAGKRTIQEWRAFREGQLKTFGSYGRDVMQTLKLSYDQLGRRLQLCVNYCSLFQKGTRIQKDEIIHIWIALGYVQQNYINQDLEEAGEEYLISLLNCGFFRARTTHNPSSIRSLIMHDVMHDLVLSQAGSEYKMADSNTSNFDKGVRHVSMGKVVADSLWKVPSSLFEIDHLDSFVVSMVPASEIKIKNWFMCHKRIHKFEYLKVLVLKGLRIKELPKSLYKLDHLRHLDLSRTGIVKLPDSITEMVNLLSLHLRRCENLQELPKHIRKLVKLRHLELKLSSKVSHIPMGLKYLTDLRTLDVFIVSEQSSPNKFGANVVGELAVLNGLNNIKGELSIQIRRESKGIELEAREANLNMKEKLAHLTIDFWKSTIEDETVLENLQPHANLRVLFLLGYGGNRLPRWMMDGKLHLLLPNLVSIRMKNCKGCKHLCSLGRLPHLKDLFLEALDSVEYIESNNDGTINTCNSGNEIEDELPPAPLFPNLERLYVKGMPKLKGWWNMASCGSQDSRQNIPRCPKIWYLAVDSVELAVTVGRSLLRNHTSLRCMSIESKLTISRPFRQPQSFVSLNTCFPNLSQLIFYHIDDLEIIPEEFRQFSSLEVLHISKCKQLKEVPEWIDSLTSLKTLYIKSCLRLESLPQQIEKLTELQSLLIFECSSKLEENCQKSTGKCWRYIKHIPRIYITTSDDF